MIDIKTLSCCDKYASCHDSSAASVVNKRQEEASAAYRTKAKELDRLLIAKQVVAVSPLGTPGPYESVLNGFGKSARAGGRRLRRNALRRAPPHGPHRVSTGR